MRLTQRRQRVRRLPGLADHDNQRPLIHNRVTVAELRGKEHLHRDTRQPFQHIFPRNTRMIRRAARDDHNLADRPDLLVGHMELFNYDFSVFNPRGKCIRHRLWLLIHLFEHKMLITALLCGIHIPLDPHGLLFNGLLVHIEEPHLILCHKDDLFIFNKINVPRVLQDCRDVRGKDAAVIHMPYDQRAVLAHGIQLARMIPEKDAKRIRALHPVHDLGDSAQRVSVIIIVQQMRDDLRIRVRDKFIAFHFQLFFQL